MVDIFAKIDEIREKPEHIRRMYVWLCVAVFMILVIGLWFISLKSSLKNSVQADNQENKLDIMGEIKNSTNGATATTNGSTSGNDLKSLSNQ